MEVAYKYPTIYYRRNASWCREKNFDQRIRTLTFFFSPGEPSNRQSRVSTARILVDSADHVELDELGCLRALQLEPVRDRKAKKLARKISESDGNREVT